MKKITILILLFQSLSIIAQENPIWKRINQNEGALQSKNAFSTTEELQFELDEMALKKSLFSINDKTIEQNTVVISFPNTIGQMEQFLVKESSNFSRELQSKYPEIRAYTGVGITDPMATLNFSVSPHGAQTMILRADTGSEYIEQNRVNKSVYILFKSKKDKATSPFSCSTDDTNLSSQLLSRTQKIKSSQQIFKTFRLALSCNGEYAQYHGGTIVGALAAMNATMTRINAVFNKDLAVKFEIITNNDKIIYLDQSTDPYSDSSIGAENPDGALWNLELQKNLTDVITSANYDVGHLLSGSGGGGNAGCIGCICVDPTTSTSRAKGSGYSAPGNRGPEGDAFDIDIVAHEMGHQLGGNHTFSHKTEGRGANIEPGSGSTIMGYAGVTDYNVQPSSDDYYSVNSIVQIQNNLSSKTCSVDTVITNSPPVINAGQDRTIPNGTAFVLKGTGADIDGNNITYCWEQNDTAVTQIDGNSIAFSSKVDGPLFRSFYPTTSAVRYMPSYKDVLKNKLTTKWESVSSIERTLHFSLTARDNTALGTSQTKTDDMIVYVSKTAGPFAVTSQNMNDIGWAHNSSQTISWSVNGSDALAGAANINIKLSTDGGLTFPIVLAANTPNDGMEIINVPTINALDCRILIEPTDNIFYAINANAFAIGYSVTSECNTYTFDAPFNIPESSIYDERIITVPGSLATITNISVNLGLTHTFMADAEIDIISPLGTAVKLLNKNCGNSSLLLQYDDSGNAINCALKTQQMVIPSQPLGVLNGENPQNNWALRFRDVNNGDLGTINSASLTICTQTYKTLAASKFTIDNFLLYPNPSNGSFAIQFNSQSNNEVKIMVHDLLGRIIYQNSYKNDYIFKKQIQLKNIQPGVYFVTVIDGDRKEERKIIIE